MLVSFSSLERRGVVKDFEAVSDQQVANLFGPI
jgi:hypothetical protein